MEMMMLSTKEILKHVFLDYKWWNGVDCLQSHRNKVFRVLQCSEEELAQMVSTMSDGWNFEQVWPPDIYIHQVTKSLLWIKRPN